MPKIIRMEILDLEDYPIYVGDIGESLPALLDKVSFSALFVLVDENTRRHCLPRVLPLLPAGIPLEILEIPSGEIHKNIATCQNIWEMLLRAGADRQALMLNLGGGVIGDMGGFCAATFKRGIRFVQMPGTLLSQVDASIGGKLGIDFGEVKNSIGVFQNPLAVFVDPAFLDTLSERELRSGFAEIIKHALIADGPQWQTLLQSEPKSHFKNAATILHSLHIKRAVVQADPYEKGIRKALNFGHTVGHAVESWSLGTDAPLLHGEAVAVGMICEAWLSRQLAGLPEQDLNDIAHWVDRMYALPKLPAEVFPELIALMRNDKKNTGGKINCTLLESAGQARIDGFVEEDLLLKSLHFFNHLT